MALFRLYRVPLREDALSDGSETSRAELAKQGLLDGGSNVDSVSGEPPDVVLDAQYRRLYPERYGLSMAELLESQALQALALAPRDEDKESEWDGYYAVDTTEFSRTDARTSRSVETRATLTKEGTRSDNRRAVRTRISQPDPGNVIGNATTALIGVPADATRVKWYDRKYDDSVSADAVDTVQARYGDVDLYDARDVEDDLGDDPVLTYKSPSYDAEGDVDPSVWDSYGNEDPRDDDGALQWGRVFDPSHDPRGDDELVIENGLLRLWLQDGLEKNIRAERWQPTGGRDLTGSLYASDDGRGGIIYASDDGRGGPIYAAGRGPWNTVDLPDTGWTLVETDFKRIGAIAVDAQLVFEDEDGDEFVLNLRLERGYEDAQFFLPDGSDPIPDGLEEMLEPIANESVYQTGATLGLVSRRELRK